MTSSVPDDTVWWGCADCGVDVELPAEGTAGVLLPCPDCPGMLAELWRWEPADHPPAGRQAVRRGSAAA